MVCTENKQRRISDSQIIYDGALCDNGSHFVLTKQLQLRWWRNRRAASVCIFSFHDKIGIMEEDKDQENSSISYTGTFLVFSVRGISFFASSTEKHLFFDRSICILAFLQSVIWINTLIFEMSLFENSMSVSDGQRILWTTVEKFCNLLMLSNLYFYITIGTLFIWTIKIKKYRLLILSLSEMFSLC